MNNKYVRDMRTVKEHFKSWWDRDERDMPLMRVTAVGRQGEIEQIPPFQSVEEKYLDVPKIVGNYRNFCESRYFLADAFPGMNLSIGPGSMALYLGGEPIFSDLTVWYKELLGEASMMPELSYNENDPWLLRHLKMYEEARELVSGDFYVNMPDIIENLDILAALRGPQTLCYDLVDYPDEVAAGVMKLDSIYFNYYDRFYELAKDEDGGNTFVGFCIWGPGRTAKLQCDFSAMISPDMFREIVVPSLRSQCRRLDYSMYHLDGPAAIRHMDALMEIEELGALQWTFGAGQPDASDERWFAPVFDKARAAGKAMWMGICDGGPKEWYEGACRILRRYGTAGVYLLFPDFGSVGEAEDFIASISEFIKEMKKA